MKRLLSKFKIALKDNLRIRQSFSLSGLRKDIKLESIRNGDISSPYNLSEYTFEQPLLNIDFFDIAQYEHFFIISDQIDSKLISSNIASKVNLPSTFIKTKSFEILDGIQVLMRKSTLPKKITDVISVVETKLRIIYPDYVNDSKSDVNTTIAYQFITDVITNTNLNAAYIDVSLQIGFIEKAFHYMKKIRTENKYPACITHKSVIVDSNFYEPAAYILGKKGKLNAIMTLITEMEDAHILPSIPVLFAGFEAAGRQESIDSTIVRRIFSLMERHNMNISKALIKAHITHDNYSFIMKAINSLNLEVNLPLSNSINRKPKKILQNTPLNSSIEDMNKYFDQQIELEKDNNNVDQYILKDNCDNELLSKVATIEAEWKSDLKIALKRRQNLLIGSDRWRLYPFLMALSINTYVDVMMDVLYRCMHDKTMQFTHINNFYLIIGETLESRYRYRCLKKEKYFSQLKMIYGLFLTKLEMKPNDIHLDDLWNQAILENISQGNIQQKSISWDRKLKSNIGKVLYQIMFENLNVTFRDHIGVETRTPVLYEEMVEEAGNCYTAVRVQSKVASMFKFVNKASLTFSALELPMIHPPIPISDNFTSRYFHVSNYATRLIRKSCDLELFDDDLHQPGEISSIYNALNILGMCSWRIDTDNLDLVSKIFRDKGSLKLKIPIRAEEIEAPKRPKDLSNYKISSEYSKEFSDHLKYKKEMYALWVTLFYKINIAQKFRDKPFWFPYSMDFRSRVYPCSPHLNHIGDDTTRGLLKFSAGKRLGPNGLDWLKIHLINIYGSHKRSSNEDRLKAADENMSEIIDSVLNPLNGRKWWQESEKPWQTLSACREIFLAIRFADEKGNGFSDDFISHLGVHQDGSCNGLQHYAALGRDAEGAKAVNLINLSNPQDVYSDVLKYVKQKIKSDSEKGVAEARDIDGLITRKVIKQTVMTTVYGVTQIGAKEQIQKQLKELEALPAEKLVKCSVYLSKIVLSSIGEIFCSATKIQNWLVELASSVAKCCDANISWRTPLNLIVTQPYFQAKSPNILTPDARKNKNAFPPNFIHSLDSTHMMKTALRCWQNNVTFVSVHDCYWTHACDVDAMNKICREEFVELYKQPILEDLSEYLYQKYGFHRGGDHNLTKRELNFNRLCKNIPKKGSYNIEDVLQSTYFFS